MDTAMRRITYVFILLSALVVFAKPTEKLPLTKELQAEELPWFAFDAKDGDGTYDRVINRDNLKEFAKQKKYRKIVLSFYATWCIPCREGLVRMSKKAAELEKNGVLIVLVNVGEDDYGKISRWVSGYVKDEWLLGFDRFNNLTGNFGLSKNGDEMPLPRTLLLNQNLRPLMLIGQEGDDFPQIFY